MTLSRTKKLFFIFVVAFGMLNLLGCSRDLHHYAGQPISFNAIKILEKRLAPWVKEMPDENKTISNIVLVIPSDRLFSGGSSNLISSAYKTLNNLLDLYSYFQIEDIYITSYTQDVPLARRQAEQIANYFWNNGLKMDTRMAFARGTLSGKLAKQVKIVAKVVQPS